MSVKDVVIGLVSNELAGILLFVPVVLVAGFLTIGTDALTAIGLPRETAGGFVVAVTIVAVVAGMYWFVTRAIHW